MADDLACPTCGKKLLEPATEAALMVVSRFKWMTTQQVHNRLNALISVAAVNNRLMRLMRLHFLASEKRSGKRVWIRLK